MSNVAAAIGPPRDLVVVEIIEGETLADAYDILKNEAIIKLEKDNKAKKLSDHTIVCDNIIVCLLRSFGCYFIFSRQQSHGTESMSLRRSIYQICL